MRIGEYELVVEDQKGQVVWREAMTAATGHPRVGDALLIGDNQFVVQRVCHSEDKGARTSRRYTFAIVFARLDSIPETVRRPRARTSRRG